MLGMFIGNVLWRCWLENKDCVQLSLLETHPSSCCDHICRSPTQNRTKSFIQILGNPKLWPNHIFLPHWLCSPVLCLKRTLPQYPAFWEKEQLLSKVIFLCSRIRSSWRSPPTPPHRGRESLHPRDSIEFHFHSPATVAHSALLQEFVFDLLPDKRLLRVGWPLRQSFIQWAPDYSSCTEL